MVRQDPNRFVGPSLSCVNSNEWAIASQELVQLEYQLWWDIYRGDVFGVMFLYIFFFIFLFIILNM